MKKRTATDGPKPKDLGSHDITSNEADSLGDSENSFMGVGTESTEMTESTIELVDKADHPKETGRLMARSADHETFELDAWYGSFPEDQKELENFRAPDALEVIIGTDDRTRINPTTSYPWRAICSLLIRTKTGKSYIGTGWFVSPRTVVTAGHCIYLHNEGGWAQSIEVIPGRNGSLRPYGSAVSSNLRSVSGWTASKNRNYDYGAIILPTSAPLGKTVGFFGIANKNDSFLKSTTLNLSGYPGDKDGGSTQWFHFRQSKGVTSQVITYEIDTMGGQSGSPVWYKSGDQRYAVGIHTNGHSSGNSATRINLEVYNNLLAWKSLGL